MYTVCEYIEMLSLLYAQKMIVIHAACLSITGTLLLVPEWNIKMGLNWSYEFAVTCQPY